VVSSGQQWSQAVSSGYQQAHRGLNVGACGGDSALVRKRCELGGKRACDRTGQRGQRPSRMIKAKVPVIVQHLYLLSIPILPSCQPTRRPCDPPNEADRKADADPSKAQACSVKNPSVYLPALPVERLSTAAGWIAKVTAAKTVRELRRRDASHIW